MQFVFPVLAWGFLLVAVPLLIHLINLLRHRRQPWAAMDFLLESYRKHRRWVWLKQALLLLSRMAIMALIVAMLAQWVSGSRWLSIFGETITHHYILLDDSFSMYDQQSGTNSYQKGLAAIQSTLRQAVTAGGSHQVTLIRWSRAEIAHNTLRHQQSPLSSKPPNDTRPPTGNDANDKSSSDPDTKSTNDSDNETELRADIAADLLARSVPRDPTELLERLISTSPSNLGCSCDEALKLILPLVEATPSQQARLYIVSDFRKKDWNQNSIVRDQLEALQAKNVSVDLIDCATVQHQNLTVVELAPEDEILAAGVPLMMRVQIKNHGTAPVRNLQVRLRQLDYGASNLQPAPTAATSATVAELPTVVVDQIQPGETVTRRFQVLFARPGWQAIQSILPEDAIAVDNTASAVIQVRAGQQVLLVDGDPELRNAFFVEAALNPDPNTKTGLLTSRAGPEILRELSEDALTQYSAIFLMDIAQLDSRTLSRLRRFADQGGGIAILLGNNLTPSTIDQYNRTWFSATEGLASLQLKRTVSLPPSQQEGNADVIVQQHPVFQALLGLSQSPFQLVRVSQYVEVDLANNDVAVERPPRNDNATQVGEITQTKTLATLRNGAPWMVESYRGQGRVVVLCGGLGRDWTNWPQDPTFVVSMLKMVGYLGSFRQQQSSHPIGSPVEVAYSSREVLPEWEVLLPAPTGNQRPLIAVNAKPKGEDLLATSLGMDWDGSSEELRRAIFSPGIVEVWSTLLQGERQVRNVAFRITPTEGDLTKPTQSELLEGLRPVEVRYRTADASTNRDANTSLANRTNLLMGLLILLLLIEQCLAWSASYHLPHRVGGNL